MGKFTTTFDYIPQITTGAPATTPAEAKKSAPELLPNPYSSDAEVALEELNAKMDKLAEKLDEYKGKLAEGEAKISREQENRLEHFISFARVWSLVLTGERAGTVYPGFSLTGTIPSNLFSFSLMFTTSKDYLESTTIEPINAPEEIRKLIPMERLGVIRTANWARDYIIMPSVTVPVVRYKLKFGPGTVPSITTTAELRTGIAYDLYLQYKHGDYYVSLLDGEEKKLSLPSSIKDSGYLSSLTTVNLDLAPFHLDASLIINTKECKLAFGLGLIW